MSGEQQEKKWEPVDKTYFLYLLWPSSAAEKKALHCYTEMINYCLQSCHPLSSLNNVIVLSLILCNLAVLACLFSRQPCRVLEVMLAWTNQIFSVCFPDFNVAKEIDIVIECCCFLNISNKVQSHNHGDWKRQA